MKTVVLLFALLVAGCGYSQREAEMIGQVKKVTRVTPIICPEYLAADVSLGVMRNGVGSMSTQDVWVYVPSEALGETLKKAAENASLVKVKYDQYRLTFCVPDHVARTVEIIP